MSTEAGQAQTESDVESWLHNFDDLQARYFAHRLLDNLLYYSERDLEALLAEGVFSGVLSRVILSEQLSAGFSLSQDDLEARFKSRVDTTLFTPVMGADYSPSDSGNMVARMLVHRLGIPAKNVVYARQIGDPGFSSLILVDDNVGSGSYLRRFWDTERVKDGSLLKEWCPAHQVTASYVVMVGYGESVESLTQDITGLNIYCAESLGREHRVFSSDSAFWSNPNEKNEAEKQLGAYVASRGISLLGFADLDLAVILHKTVPDWSLPLIYEETNGWSPLMRRKHNV